MLDPADPAHLTPGTPLAVLPHERPPMRAGEVHGMVMRMSPDKGAAKRREQLAEILAEGDAVPPAAIPESHVQLVQRRLEDLARGNVTPLESEQVWAQLRGRSRVGLDKHNVHPLEVAVPLL